MSVKVEQINPPVHDSATEMDQPRFFSLLPIREARPAISSTMSCGGGLALIGLMVGPAGIEPAIFAL